MQIKILVKYFPGCLVENCPVKRILTRDMSSDDSYLGEHRNIGSQLAPSASEDRCGYTPMAIGTGLDQIRVVESVVWPLLVNIS